MNSPVRGSFQPIFVFLLMYLSLHLMFMVLHAPSVRNPFVWVASAAAFCAWMSLVIVRQGTRLLDNALALLSLQVCIVTVYANISPDQVSSFAVWWPGACAVLAASFLIFGRALMCLVTMLCSAISVGACSFLFFGASVPKMMGFVFSSLLGPLLWIVMLAAMVVLTSRIGGRRTLLQVMNVEQSAQAANEQQRMQRLERSVQLTRLESFGHLKELAELEPGTLFTEEQRHRWGLGAKTLRDELTSHHLLDDALRVSIAKARERGALVDIQDGYAEHGETSRCARELMRSAADRASDGVRLAIRRPPGRAAVSVGFMGPGAEGWAEEVQQRFAELEVIGDAGLAHVTMAEADRCCAPAEEEPDGAEPPAPTQQRS